MSASLKKGPPRTAAPTSASAPTTSAPKKQRRKRRMMPPKLPDETRAQVEKLRVQMGLSKEMVEEETKKLVAREAKARLKQMVQEGVARLMGGLPALPLPTEAQLQLSPEEYVRQRALIVAPWALEARIHDAAHGDRVTRREAQQELLDRAGFGRRTDAQPALAVPPIQIVIGQNPYLQPNTSAETVDGELVGDSAALAESYLGGLPKP